MKYTVFCPCHSKRPIVDSGDRAVEIGHQMTCAHCACVHRVADVEAGDEVGAVRLARLGDAELAEVYRERGIELVIIACPHCLTRTRALGDAARMRDGDYTSVMPCPTCHLPMIVEGDTTTGYTARRLSDDELDAAMEHLRPTLAAQLDALFPDTPFGNSPFGKGDR